eukprot:scaffold62428_cov58-Attheya_sp.AAC.4
MSIFMLTQCVNPCQLLCLENKVLTAVNQMNHANRGHKALEEKFLSLKRNYDNLTNDFKTLKGNKTLLLQGIRRRNQECNLVQLRRLTVSPLPDLAAWPKNEVHGAPLRRHSVVSLIRLGPELERFAQHYGGSWGVRGLTSKEVYSANDWPQFLVNKAAALLLAPPPLLPGKCLHYGFRALMGNGGGKDPVPASRSSDTTQVGLRPVSRSSTGPAEQGSSKMPRVESDLMGLHPVGESTSSVGPVPVGESMSSAGPAPVIELDAISREIRERKATKADDAEVPTYLWDKHLLADSDFGWTDQDMPRLNLLGSVLKKLMLNWWTCQVTRSLFEWLRKRHLSLNNLAPSSAPKLVTVKEGRYTWTSKGKTKFLGFGGYAWTDQGRSRYLNWWRLCRHVAPKDMDTGADAVLRAARSSWWEWLDGSRPFHWRWPLEYQEIVRDGLPIYFMRKPPRYVKPQRDVREPEIKKMVHEKLDKIRDRSYVAPGHVESLISFFPVEKTKGDVVTDIRMVYDGSGSGLNECMWVPRFTLPTIHTHLRSVGPDTYMSDVDLGEFFLNFILHPSVRPFMVVDFTQFYLPPTGEPVWEPYQRAAIVTLPNGTCHGVRCRGYPERS